MRLRPKNVSLSLGISSSPVGRGLYAAYPAFVFFAGNDAPKKGVRSVWGMTERPKALSRGVPGGKPGPEEPHLRLDGGALPM